MNITLSWLDWVLAALLVMVMIVGFRRGFWVSVGTVIGAIAGVIAGVFLLPLIVQLVPAGMARIGTMIVVTAVTIWLGMTIGRKIGRRLRLHVNHPVMRAVDKILGVIGNTAIAGLLIALVSFSLSSIGAPGISATLSNSRIVQLATHLTPEPVRVWVADLRSQIIASSAMPELELVDKDADDEPAAPEEPNRYVLEASEASVRITGSAYECGQSQTGSGFAVTGDRVVTNAHVVAGVENPKVESYDGQFFTGEVVVFDPERDIAVIALPQAQLPVLEFGDELVQGQPAFVLGFPSGGPHQILHATVQAHGPATVENIYEENPQLRHIYQLAANVKQGNSGGALVDSNGDVVGVLFARAAEAEVGYALSHREVADVVDSAAQFHTPVSTGQCLE